MITQLIYVQRVHGALGTSCPCHPGLSLGAEITFQKGPPGWCGSFVPGAQGIRLAETSSTPRSPVVSGMARAGESCGETLSTTGLRCSRVPTLGGAEPQSGCGGVFAVR